MRANRLTPSACEPRGIAVCTGPGRRHEDPRRPLSGTAIRCQPERRLFDRRTGEPESRAPAFLSRSATTGRCGGWTSNSAVAVVIQGTSMNSSADYRWCLWPGRRSAVGGRRIREHCRRCPRRRGTVVRRRGLDRGGVPRPGRGFVADWAERARPWWPCPISRSRPPVRMPAGRRRPRAGAMCR